MTYVLSLRPHSPLKRSFSDNPYLQSYSPLTESFLGSSSDVSARNASACSLYTVAPHESNSWALGNENTPPVASQSLLNLIPQTDIDDLGVQLDRNVQRQRACRINRTPPLLSSIPILSNPASRKPDEVQYTDRTFSGGHETLNQIDVEDDGTEEHGIFDLYEAINVPLPEVRLAESTSIEKRDTHDLAPDAFQNGGPFRRWMSTLRRRHLQRRLKQDLSFDGGEELLAVRLPLPATIASFRRTSESMTSSLGFVTTVKTTSVTAGSTSFVPTAEKGLPDMVRISNRSNYVDARRSAESHRGGLSPVIDESAWLRSLQRRKVVEELIASEESYIADLKVLINVRRFF